MPRHSQEKGDGWGESVYNLIPAPEVKHKKAPRYKSTIPKDLPPSCSTFGLKGTTKLVGNVGGQKDHPDKQGANHHFVKPHATMGERRATLRNTNTFLRKREGDQPLSQPSNFKYTDTTGRKPAVPKRNETPVMGLISDKDFVKANAVENMLRQPPAPAPLPADKVDYRMKPEYGQIPEYLDEVKREVEDENEYIKLIHEQEQAAREVDIGEQPAELLSEEERQELITQLRGRWDEVNNVYQQLQFVNVAATGSKKALKERCERELDQIEKHLNVLQKNYVFVQD